MLVYQRVIQCNPAESVIPPFSDKPIFTETRGGFNWFHSGLKSGESCWSWRIGCYSHLQSGTLLLIGSEKCGLTQHVMIFRVNREWSSKNLGISHYHQELMFFQMLSVVRCDQHCFVGDGRRYPWLVQFSMFISFMNVMDDRCTHIIIIYIYVIYHIICIYIYYIAYIASSLIPSIHRFTCSNLREKNSMYIVYSDIKWSIEFYSKLHVYQQLVTNTYMFAGYVQPAAPRSPMVPARLTPPNTTLEQTLCRAGYEVCQRMPGICMESCSGLGEVWGGVWFSWSPVQYFLSQTSGFPFEHD